MKEMPDNSVDSIVTDPPYELTSGKNAKTGFMGMAWDGSGIAFNVEVWQEALRVLKPGGHLIAFSGSRTYHRMAVAIEDAGFEIRDQIMWVYGSGFPKSHNISKGIDKAAGAKREVVGSYQGATNIGKVEDGKRGYSPGTDYPDVDRTVNITAPATEAAKQWDGWGTALKPAHEPMVLARKPLIGTVANNVLTYGTGGLNIDGSRVSMGNEYDPKKIQRQGKNDGVVDFGAGGLIGKEIQTYKEGGRWPANFIHDGSDEVVALFPSSTSKSGGKSGTNANPMSWTENNSAREREGHDDSGSAARFFYCAKASKRDRNEGLDGFAVKQTLGGGGLTEVGGAYGSIKAAGQNHHPTVKPTDLMRYLVRLVTPPSGTVLDPFMGSGSTGKAAILEGFDFIGIEQSAEYLEIAKARIEYAQKQEKDYLL